MLSAFFIGMPFLWGYQLRVMQRVARGTVPPLPEWDDPLDLFVDGLKVLVVLLAHWLGAVLLLVPLGLALAVIPTHLPDAVVILLVLFVMLMILAAVVAFVALSIYVQAGIVRMAILGDLGEAFAVGENIAFLRRNLVPTVLAWLAFMVAHFVSQAGILLCCVGILPATFWAMLVLAYGLGEVARLDPEYSRLARGAPSDLPRLPKPG